VPLPYQVRTVRLLSTMTLLIFHITHSYRLAMEFVPFLGDRLGLDLDGLQLPDHVRTVCPLCTIVFVLLSTTQSPRFAIEFPLFSEGPSPARLGVILFPWASPKPMLSPSSLFHNKHRFLYIFWCLFVFRGSLRPKHVSPEDKKT